MFDVAIALQWTLGGIYGTLTFAGVATGLLGRVRPTWSIAEVATRIRTWWAMTIVFTVALIAGPVVSIALFAVVSLLAMREFHRLAGVTSGVARTISYAAVPISYGLVAAGYPVAGWVTPIVTAAAVVPIVAAVSGQVTGFINVVSKSAAGLLLTVWAPMHAVLLLSAPGAGVAGGAGLLVFVVLVTEVGDVAQFLTGKTFGRRPIAPDVSPNKTRGGLIGGIMIGALLALGIGPLLTPFDLATSAAIGALIAAFGFGGDLVVSAIKRDSGVKDTGTLLPGHGGVLDRIDSLIATAPLFALFIWSVL
ncbi:MAG: phosphatidate cytidylyltransferase [bacterium]|nr:phosphatidate cytidylyltransferase [bacterium]